MTPRGKSEPRTHCKQGHKLTPENTYKLDSGYSVCKECELDRVRIRRGSKPRIAKEKVDKPRREYKVARTHCKNGHELTEDNTYLLGRGTRVCKICERARVAAKSSNK